MTDIATLRNFLPPSYFDASGNLTVSQAEAEQVAAGIQARVADMPPAEAAIFLSMLKASDLAPGSGLSSADLEGALDRLEGAAKEINSMSRFGTTLEMLSRIMIEQAAEQRKNALESRLDAREQAKSELMGQAETMREAANKIMSGAIASLVMTVVMSAVSIAASGYSLAKSGQATKNMIGEMKTAGISKADFGKSNFQFTPETQRMASKGQSFETMGRLSSTVGQTAAGASTSLAESESKKLEAEGSEDAAEAQYQQSQADIAKDLQTSLDEMIKHIINFLKELREAQADQMRAFTRV